MSPVVKSVVDVGMMKSCGCCWLTFHHQALPVIIRLAVRIPYLTQNVLAFVVRKWLAWM